MNSYKDLTEEQISLLPTEEEILQYEKLGWYISPVILSDDLLDKAVVGGEALYRGERNIESPEAIEPFNDVYDETKVFMNNEYVSLQREELRDVVYKPIVSAIAAKLSRTNEIRLFADGLMCKFPAKEQNKGVFGWHTDKAYWPSCTSNNMLTAWIPFQDTTIDMGVMSMIEGSHYWEMDDELKQFCGVGNQNLDEFEEYLQKNKSNYKIHPITLKKGQLSFHNCNVFHGSSANKSKKNRMALAIHMQDAKNSYKPSFKENGEKIIIGYERICGKNENGDPDYNDPQFFPKLWSDKK